MHVQDIVHEDFINYKKPSMFIGAAHCSGKCGEACQNKALWDNEPILVGDDDIIRKYLNNPLTKAIVIGGLEPFDQWIELKNFLWKLRNNYQCSDDVVIYTGYDLREVAGYVNQIKMFFDNVIIKFGRYRPDLPSRIDPNLGVKLASNNQHSIVINREVT